MKYRGTVLNDKRIIVTSNLNNIRHDEVGIKEEDNGRFYLYEVDKLGNISNMGPNGVLNIEKNGEYNIRDYSKVIVNIPEPTPPTDILNIVEDGTYPCTDYGEVEVNVNNLGETSIGTGSQEEIIDCTHYHTIHYYSHDDYGTLDISSNGYYDTTNYSGVNVNVTLTLEEIAITKNGTYTPSGDGFSVVNVNVMPEYDIYDINNDGTYEVSQYRTANVSVNYLGTTSFGTGSNCTTVDVTNYHSIDCYYDDNSDLGQLTITENGIYDTTNYSSVDVNISSSNNDYLPLSKLGAIPFMVDISVFDETSDKHIEIIDGTIINSAVAFFTITDIAMEISRNLKGINVYVGPDTVRMEGGFDLLELLAHIESMITAGTSSPLYIIKDKNEDKYNFSNYIFYYDESTDLSSRSEEEIKWNGIDSPNRIYGMFYNNILYVNS